jgi:hypothetical protein
MLTYEVQYTELELHSSLYHSSLKMDTAHSCEILMPSYNPTSVKTWLESELHAVHIIPGDITFCPFNIAEK